jgi:hypothetical protein
MKPYRVKRGQKFIGSFIVVHDGKRVNLATKDASEARRRAALVAKGLWPPAGNDAATAVKQSLEGEVSDDDEPLEEAAPPTVAASPVPDSRSAVPPVPDAVPVPEQVEADPVAAVNATATAMDAENEALLAGAKDALADAGIDLADIKAKMPTLLASGHLWLQGQLARSGVRIVKGKWPMMVTLPADDPLREMIGKLDAAFLARVNLDVEKIGPGWLLLILSAVTTIAQVGGMLEGLAQQEKAEAEKVPA